MTEGTPPVPPSQPPPGVEPPPPPPTGAIPPPPPPPPPPVGGPYPTTFGVDYPDRELDKRSTLLRIIWVIPIAAVLFAIGSGFTSWASGGNGARAAAFSGLLVLPTLLMIVGRHKYPRWWFDFNLELMRFIMRVSAYFLLMSDEYPSTDEHQYVHLDIKYPDAETELHQFMPLIKWFLAIPHYIILFFIGIGALFATVGAWFVILFTGRYPHDIFELVEGVLRWNVRVYSYAFLLTTDEYPPFRLAP